MFINNFKTAFKLKILSKIKEQILNAHNFVLNLVVHSSLTDPDLEFRIRVVSRSGSGSGSTGSVAALIVVASDYAHTSFLTQCFPCRKHTAST